MRPCSIVFVALACLALAGCGAPRDPRGTLARVEGGTLRVGLSENAAWTPVEKALIDRLAAELSARPDYSPGAESVLIARLERGDLDMVAGGLERSAPWKDKVGFTLPYPGGGGRHVLATAPGENAFLLRVDRFLAAQER